MPRPLRVPLLLLALLAGAPSAAGQARAAATVGDTGEQLTRLSDGRLTRWSGVFAAPAAAPVAAATAPSDASSREPTSAPASASSSATSATSATSAPAATVAAFVAEHGTRFGVGHLGTPRALDTTADAARAWFVPQLIHGVPLADHGLWLRLDDQQRVVLAHGVLSDAADTLPPAHLPAADVVPRARASVGAHTGPATVTTEARLTADGPRLLHLVDVVVELIPYRVTVDAHDGALVSVVERSSHGGVFVWDGAPHAFDTGAGRGRVYPSVQRALKASASPRRLADLAVSDALLGVAEAGSLLGAHARVRGATGVSLLSPTLHFDHDDQDPTPAWGQVPASQLFDHVNTYHWLARGGRFHDQLLGQDSSAGAVPVFVNYDQAGQGYANAFFSPADLDGPGGLSPGYLLFGEFSGLTGDPLDDFSRDPSVVLHEQAHLVVARQGLAFGEAPLDTPPRALNEALADYAAASQLGRPELGAVLAAHSGAELGLEGDAVRHLDGELTLPDDLPAALDPLTGLPEEHAVGELFASFLWDLRQALGPRLADALVLTGLDAWPQSTAEVGHPVVTAANAEAATRATLAAATAALAADLPGHGPKAARKLGLLWGAAASRGLVGTGADDAPVLVLEGSDRQHLTGCFRGSLDSHTFELDLTAGQLLSLSLRGRQGTTVDIDLPGAIVAGQDPSAPAELLALVPKSANGNGTRARFRKVEVLVSGRHRVTVRGTGAGGGDYQLLVRTR